MSYGWQANLPWSREETGIRLLEQHGFTLVEEKGSIRILREARHDRLIWVDYDGSSRDRYRDRAEHVFRMYGTEAAENPFGFVHLLAAQDFAQRGPLEIILAGDKLGATALAESVHRAYLPARVLAFAEDVSIGEGRHPVDGQPAAYVCRNRTCDAPVTSVKALLERCAT